MLRKDIPIIKGRDVVGVESCRNTLTIWTGCFVKIPASHVIDVRKCNMSIWSLPSTRWSNHSCPCPSSNHQKPSLFQGCISLGSRGNQTVARLASAADTKGCDSYQCVLLPLNTFLFVGIGVWEAFNLTRLSAEKTVKIWSDFVAISFNDWVTLSASCLEKVGTLLVVTYEIGQPICSLKDAPSNILE